MTTPIPVTVTFSEEVTGFDVSDIAITNGEASNLTGSGTSYSFDLVPTAYAAVTASVRGDGAVDAAGNGNTASGTLRPDLRGRRADSRDRLDNNGSHKRHTHTCDGYLLHRRDRFRRRRPRGERGNREQLHRFGGGLLL